MSVMVPPASQSTAPRWSRGGGNGAEPCTAASARTGPGRVAVGWGKAAGHKPGVSFGDANLTSGTPSAPIPPPHFSPIPSCLSPNQRNQDVRRQDQQRPCCSGCWGCHASPLSLQVPPHALCMLSSACFAPRGTQHEEVTKTGDSGGSCRAEGSGAVQGGTVPCLCCSAQ